jgi:hypothetical protein
VPWPLSHPASFRYWIDYQAFSSPESAALPEAALIALGGVKTGGPPKLDPLTAAKQKIRDYGYMHMDKWELLLSITAKAMLAAEVSSRKLQEGCSSSSSCCKARHQLQRSSAGSSKAGVSSRRCLGAVVQ